MSEIPKCYRNDEVAVLYSPGNSGGWYTWNKFHLRMLYEPLAVAWVLDGKLESERESLEVTLRSIYGDEIFLGGLEDIEIEWLPKGTSFRVEDVSGDGYEQIEIQKEDWHVA